MKTGDIIMIADRKYVVYEVDEHTKFPTVMDFETGDISYCYFPITPEAVVESKPDNIVWLKIKRDEYRLKKRSG